MLSVVIGKVLGLTRRSLEELALGAILHDLGKARLHPGPPGIDIKLAA